MENLFVKYCKPFFPVSTCNDGVKNADETGVDCGGSCALQNKKCADLMNCLNAADCISGVCKLSICQGEYIYLQCKEFELAYCSSHL
jgi:hypothetical protein